MKTTREINLDLGDSCCLGITGVENEDDDRVFTLTLNLPQHTGEAAFNFQTLVDVRNEIDRMVDAFNKEIR